MKKRVHIRRLEADDLKFLVNNKVVTVYRDMDGDVMTRPTLEPLELSILRKFIEAMKV